MKLVPVIRELLANGFTSEEALRAVEIFEDHLPKARMATTRTAALRVPCPFCFPRRP